MDDQTSELQLVVVIALVAATLGFVLFVQSGGFLAWAIDRAIQDERVIPGMTREDVIASWGRPHLAEEHNIRVAGVNRLAALTWTYETPTRAVHFNGNGIVIWVDD
jgi:hypothetical protein